MGSIWLAGTWLIANYLSNHHPPSPIVSLGRRHRTINSQFTSDKLILLLLLPPMLILKSVNHSFTALRSLYVDGSEEPSLLLQLHVSHAIDLYHSSSSAYKSHSFIIIVVHEIFNRFVHHWSLLTSWPISLISRHKFDNGTQHTKLTL